MIATLLAAALSVAAHSAQSQAATQGYVVRVDSGGVYLDLGAQAGASVGQAFDVYKEGEELKHPITGQSLGRVETIVASGTIDQVAPLYSVGSLARPAGIEAGMRARLGRPMLAPAAASAAPAPRSGEAALRAPRMKGPSFDFTISAMSVADFLGTGKPQLALADKTNIYLFPYPPQDNKPVAMQYLGGVDPRILSLSAGDLDGDGKAELFISVYNESLGRVETQVYGVDGGKWKKLSELPWLVRQLDDAKGQEILATQQLEDTDFPFSAIYPLEYKGGKYGPGKPAIRHKRVDWLYDFTMAKLDEGDPALVYMTSNNRLRAQFDGGSSSTSESYGQTPVRMRWPNAQGRLLEFHPPIVVVPGGNQKSSLFVVRNIAMLGSLAEPFGLFNGGEVTRFSWNGVSLQPDWKSELGGYSTSLAFVPRAGGAGDLAVAVDGTSGKSSIWIYDP